MKAYTLLINFLLFYSTLVSGQKDISFVVRKPDSKVVAMELTKMNVVYIGVDNPILIVSSREIGNITISNGSLMKSDIKNSYIIRVSEGTETTVKVFTNGPGGKDELLEQRIFRIKRVPDPVAKFAGKTGNASITRNELLNALGLIADLENFDFDFSIRIVSFDISGITNGFEVSLTSKSNMLTEAQRNFLRQLTPGTKIYIENINAIGSDRIERLLKPINLKIIN